MAALELSQPHFSVTPTSAERVPITTSSLANDEARAIARTLQGDVNAFNELVLRYERVAYSVAYRLLQSSDMTSDAVQESFLKAFRALPSFRNGSFKSWLMRIVVNTCYDIIRLDRRFATEDIGDRLSNNEDDGGAHQVIDPHELPLAFVERSELRARIELGLRTLPVEQRSVLVLSDIHGYSYQEISEITGMAMGTVKSRISRARLKLTQVAT